MDSRISVMDGPTSPSGSNRVSWRDSAPLVAGLVGAAALVLFLALPLVALLIRVWQRTTDFDDATRTTLEDALLLTLRTSLITLLVIVLLGTPLAYTLARLRFPGSRLVETLVDLPMVLPPAVAGLALLMAFGRRGLIGEQLADWGIEIGFTTTAVVLAQIWVATPFYVRAARAGFSASIRPLEDAAADLGATPWRVFRTITLPLARPSLSAGAVLAWARAVGEFGATIMFAGNTPGRTQTMSLAVYGRFEAGDTPTSLLLAALLLAAAALVLFGARLIDRPILFGR